MRTKSSILNVIVSLIDKIISIISGFFLSRFILLAYGSSINGLIASIKQFVKYISLFEMGISGAAIYQLYSPLAKNDINSINNILDAAKKYYFKSGILFSISTILIGIFYSFFIVKSDTPSFLIFLVFLLLSSSTALDFFAISKYKILFNADQKEYIISFSTIFYTLTYFVLALLVVFTNGSFVLMQSTLLVAFFVRALIIFLFYKYKYKEKFSSYSSLKKNKIKILQKYDVLLHEISWLIISSTPIILITLFYSLSELSVYSVYYFVFGNLILLLSIFNSSFTSSFADLITRGELEKFSKTFHLFEFFYFFLSTLIFITAFQLSQPFIDLYTTGVIDITYNNFSILSILFFFGISNSFRVPYSILISSIGAYKKTVFISLLITILGLLISLFAIQFKISFAIIGGIFSYTLKGLYFLFVAKKSELKLKVISTLLSIVTFFLCSIISISISSALVVTNPNSYWEFATNLLVVFTTNLIIFFVVSLPFNYAKFYSLFKQIFTFFKIRKL